MLANSCKNLPSDFHLNEMFAHKPINPASNKIVPALLNLKIGKQTVAIAHKMQEIQTNLNLSLSNIAVDLKTTKFIKKLSRKRYSTTIFISKTFYEKLNKNPHKKNRKKRAICSLFV